jgi:hypothetical protein
MLSRICCQVSGWAMGGGRGGLRDSAESDADAGLRDVDGHGAEDEAEGGYDLKEDEGLESDAADAAELIVASNAGDDAAEDERGNDYADETEKDFPEEVGLGGKGWGVDPEFCAGEHG